VVSSKEEKPQAHQESTKWAGVRARLFTRGAGSNCADMDTESERDALPLTDVKGSREAVPGKQPAKWWSSMFKGRKEGTQAEASEVGGGGARAEAP